MKVELLVSEWCPTCPAAERIWRDVAAEKEIEFAVLDFAQPEGRELAHRLQVRTIPALAVDGVLKAVGVQTPGEARELVAAAHPRARASPRHAGMLLSAENRWFIGAGMAYLVAAGAWMLAEGDLLGAGAARAVGAHLFAGGFVTSLIYGVGAHMLPRFTGNPIRMGAWSWSQFAFFHCGLAALAAGLLGASRTLALAGGAGIWLSFALYAWRLWPVLWPPRRQGESGEPPGSPRAPAAALPPGRTSRNA